MSEMKYFRLLEAGETIEPGDVFLHSYSGKLLPVNDDGSKLQLGRMPHMRPVQVDEWIEYAKQKPTKYDGDVQVLDGGIPHVWSWDFYNTGNVTHWRRITPPTPTVQPILIDGKELKFNANGSILLSCGTVIDAGQVDEIFKRWEAAKKEAA